MSPLKLALLSLARHRLATFVAVVSIALSVACSGILLRVHQLMESRFSTIAQTGDAIVGAKAGGIEILLGSLNGEGRFPDFLPYALFESLKSQQVIAHENGDISHPSYIKSIIPFVYFAKFNTYRVIGTDQSFFNRPSDQYPLKLKEGSWFSDAHHVVIGSMIAKKFNLKTGDTLAVNPWIDGKPLATSVNLKVSGVLDNTGTQWDKSLFASVEKAHEVFEQNKAFVRNRSIWGSKVLHYYLIYLQPHSFSTLEELINKRTIGQIIRIDDELKKLKDLSGAGKDLGLFITSFVILLGGLSVCSMFITRFEGLSLQISVLRAIGYTKKELYQWLLWEGFFLGAMGILAGAFIDWVGLPILRSLLNETLAPADLVSSSILNSSPVWIVALGATLIAVLIPALRMSKQSAHNALKGL